MGRAPRGRHAPLIAGGILANAKTPLERRAGGDRWPSRADEAAVAGNPPQTRRPGWLKLLAGSWAGTSENDAKDGEKQLKQRASRPGSGNAAPDVFHFEGSQFS